MINGDVNEFIDGLHHGEEMEVLYKGRKFFIEGLYWDDMYMLYMWRLDPPLPPGECYIWEKGGKDAYPVEDFLNAPLWDGLTFWEAEGEIEWVGF